MKSQWDKLFDEAIKLIDVINQEHEVLTDWTFGGGTSMMLQIKHRDSHDIDLFVPDPQLHGYILAALEDYNFSLDGAEYRSDGRRHIKIEFKDIGEIDFIFAGHITSNPAELTKVRGRDVLLETVPEVVSKKICYRGRDITPRDIFDIAAASRTYKTEIIQALKSIPDQVSLTLKKLEGLNEEYIEIQMNDYNILPGFESVTNNAIEITRKVLQAV